MDIHHQVKEIINYRLQTTVLKKHEGIYFKKEKSLEKTNIIKEIYIDGKFEKCSFVNRDILEIGEIIKGISIIEESTSTCLIPKGWIAKVLDDYTLSIDRE